MKLKFMLTMALAAAAAGVNAQTHVEGAEYYNADQFDNAKELLLRNMNNSGTDKGIANYYLGQIAFRDGNMNEAKQLFKKGTEINAHYPFNYVGLGAIALKEGDKKAADEYFKQAENHGKKNAAVHVAIARALYNADPVANANNIKKRIEKAQRTNDRCADIYIFLGDQLADEKDWGGAAAKYQNAADYDLKSAAAYVKYANLYTQMNPTYAIEMLQKLLNNNPESALGQRELATAFYNNKQYKEAVEQYEGYIKNPNHFKQDEDRYAFLLFYNGNYKDGYDFASRQLAANPSNFTAQRYQFMNAAQIKEMKDELLPMAEKLYASHKANPAANKFAPIDYTLIADELATAKRYDEAIAVLKEATADMPDNANFEKQLSMVYVDQSNLPMAFDVYENYLAKTKEPGYNDYIQQAIFGYYAGAQTKDSDPAASTKYFNGASKYAAKAGEAYPDFYRPAKIEGDIAVATATKENADKAGKDLYLKSIGQLEGSGNVAKYASDAKVMYNYLGNYYLTQNDKATAKTYFNKYLELDPNNADYRKFVESLDK